MSASVTRLTLLLANDRSELVYLPVDRSCGFSYPPCFGDSVLFLLMSALLLLLYLFF